MLRWLPCLLIVFSSCYYDVEEDLVMRSPCDSEEAAYSQDVLPILENRCYKCHAADLNMGNVTLEGYENLFIYVDDGRLLGAINWKQGFTPMPQNEMMLPDCDIELIESWVEDGAPNN